MLSRRAVLKASLGLCSCAVCGPAGLSALAGAAPADQVTRIQGSGYDLRFIGAQRDTIMNGKLAAAIDLRSLASTPHLYGIGPIEQLRGEVTIIDGRPSLSRVGREGTILVTESFETGCPFLVWAEVPAWRTVPIPPEVHSFADLEALVPRTAAAIGHDQRPLPFLIHGREDLIEFHILNRIGDEPYRPDQIKKIQTPFELLRAEAIVVGFYSSSHRGVFTAMDSAIHIHFQTPDNSSSGHIQMLEIGPGAMLSLPQRI
jgi:acetolactate decarboxylase